MTNVDRRRFLTSLAASAASVSFPSMAGIAEPIPNGLEDRLCDAWLIGQPRRAPATHAIDFWSMPWADISYANYLPPQVAHGVIWHERFHGLRAVFDSIDGRDFDWIDGTPRQEAAHLDGMGRLRLGCGRRSAGLRRASR
jgi:hypothetical protein